MSPTQQICITRRCEETDSDCGGRAEQISALVDEALKEYVLARPSCIRDPGNVLKVIGGPGEIPNGSILVTLDVTSLYTKITSPHSWTAGG